MAIIRSFTAITSEGGLLPSDFLAALADPQIGHRGTRSGHLPAGPGRTHRRAGQPQLEPAQGVLGQFPTLDRNQTAGRTHDDRDPRTLAASALPGTRFRPAAASPVRSRSTAKATRFHMAGVPFPSISSAPMWIWTAARRGPWVRPRPAPTPLSSRCSTPARNMSGASSPTAIPSASCATMSP